MGEFATKWEQHLANVLAAGGAAGFEVIRKPFGRSQHVAVYRAAVHVSRDDMASLARFIGFANAAPVAGRGRGTVYIERAGIGLAIERLCVAAPGGEVAFCVRDGASWNEFYNPQTDRFEEVVNKDGQPTIPYADFLAPPRPNGWREDKSML